LPLRHVATPGVELAALLEVVALVEAAALLERVVPAAPRR